jgi:hypothetical protein
MKAKAADWDKHEIQGTIKKMLCEEHLEKDNFLILPYRLVVGGDADDQGTDDRIVL